MEKKRRELFEEEEFGVKWSFVWPYCCHRPMDLDYVNLTHFPLGVERLTHDLKFSFPVENTLLYEVVNGVVRPSTIHPKHREGNDYYYISYKVTDTMSEPDRLNNRDAYIMTWARAD